MTDITTARSYKPAPPLAPIEELPFVIRSRSKKVANTNWSVPEVDSYGEACKLGYAYGAHFCQYLKDNNQLTGMNLIGNIVSDMDFTDESDAKGVHVGFFSFLERFISHAIQDIDVFNELDHVLRCCEQMEKARA